MSRVSGDTEVTVSASSAKHAMLEGVVVRSADDRDVKLTISAHGKIPIRGRIVDDSGEPVAGARVLVRARRFDRNGRPSGWGIVPFDGQYALTTDANGQFAPESRILRNGSYLLFVDGKSITPTESDPMSPDDDADVFDFGDVVVTLDNAIVGTIVDNQGKFVEGATVWANIAYSNHKFNTVATTDVDGKFSLKNVHAMAVFAYVDKNEFRMTGFPLSRAGDESPLIITLGHRNQPPIEPPVRFTPLDVMQRQTSLQNLFNSLVPENEAAIAEFSESLSPGVQSAILSELGHIDPERTEKITGMLDQSLSRLQIWLAIGNYQLALKELRSGQVDPNTCVWRISNKIDDVSSRELQLDLFAEASKQIEKISDGNQRISAVALIANRLVLNDQREQAEVLVAQYVESAERLDPAGPNSYILARFIETLAIFEPERALKIAKTIPVESNDHGRRNDCLMAVAKAAAKTNPKVSEACVDQISDRLAVAGYLTKVIGELARADLKLALRLVENAEDRYSGTNIARCYIEVARAIADSDPKQAKALLRLADKMLSDPQLHSGKDGLALLRTAILVDSDSSAEFFWRAMALTTPIEFPTQRDFVLARKLDRTAATAVLLTLYGDRFEAELQKTMEPIWDYWEGNSLPGSRVAQWFEASFIAQVLTDPERALAWRRPYWQSLAPSDRRSLDLPWTVFAIIWNSDPDELEDIIGQKVFRDSDVLGHGRRVGQ